jgi:choline dehydrogenase-like flavoprotein
MIIDGREIASATKISADLCIVGAGPAGITLARELIHQRFSVVILESGGFDLSTDTQALCKGRVIGHPYPPLDACRHRALGGTTNVWGGWCKPLDAIDFVERDWVPWSGWPLSREELDADYERARKVCRVPHEHVESASSPPITADQTFESTALAISPTRFGRLYRQELACAANISLIMHATAVEIRLNAFNSGADCIWVASGPYHQYSVAARCFVLAAGGIENARLLLASRGSRSIGVGNEHDLVGRFFSDHLHFYAGQLEVAAPSVTHFFRPRRYGNAASRGCVVLTAAAQRQERVLGFAATGHNPRDPHDVIVPSTGHDGYASLSLIGRTFATGRIPDRLASHLRNVVVNFGDACSLVISKAWKPKWRSIVVGCRAEQAPNPGSRVLLDDEKDVFGVPQAKLDWRLTAEDFGSLHRASDLLWNQPMMRGAGVHGRTVESSIAGASHHIGTTRMHRNPKFGVVNSDCRVHSVPNLFIAGSSVFPTAGWAPPTLTIVALALRLARVVKAFLHAQ